MSAQIKNLPSNDDTVWQRIYQEVPCYIFSFNNGGTIVRMNNLLLSNLGYKNSEVIGKMKYDAFLNVGSRIFFQTHFLPMVKMRKNIEEIFLTLKAKDGSELPVLLNLVCDDSTGISETHCAGINIASRDKLERENLDAKNAVENANLENIELNNLKFQLQENQRLLETKLQRITQVNAEQKQINAILSHDLQEPLRKLSMFSNLLSTGKFDKSNQEKHLNKMSELTFRVRNLIQGMQCYHEIEGETLSISRFKMYDAVQNAIQILPYERRNNLSTNIFIEDNSAVDGDFKLISNVLSQLLDNSVKFINVSEPVKINIEVSEVTRNVFQEIENRYVYEPFVRIIYKDNSTGFDRQNTSRIFDLFRKGETNEDGLGIGLAYCRKIISMHNGLIEAASSVGSGVTITIFLPKSIG